MCGFIEKSIGCMSVPMEIKCEDGKIKLLPTVEALQYIKKSDPAITVTNDKIEFKEKKR